MSKSFFVECIGTEVIITRKAGIKNLRLLVHPTKGVSMSIPQLVSYKTALKFINEKEKWIRKKIDLHKTQRKEFVNVNIPNGYKTFNHTLEIDFSTQNSITGNTLQNTAKLSLPKSWSINDSNSQEHIRFFLKEVLILEAKRYIPLRVFDLASINKFEYNNVRIGSARTRWGSCRQDNNLTFSCYLMLMDTDLIDYIILHELTHTIHKNHGNSFYDLLNKVSNGMHKSLNARVKKFRNPLILRYNPE